MAQLFGPDVISAKSEDEFDELECIPLAIRRKLLLLSKQSCPSSDVEFDELENIPLAIRRNSLRSSNLGNPEPNGVRSEINRLPSGARPPGEEVQPVSGVISKDTARRRLVPSSKKRRPQTDAVSGETDHLPLTIRCRMFPPSEQGCPKSSVISTENRTTEFKSKVDIIVNKEDDCCDGQGLCTLPPLPVRSLMYQQSSQEYNQDVKVPKGVISEIMDNKAKMVSLAVGSCPPDAISGLDIGASGNQNSQGTLENRRTCSDEAKSSSSRVNTDRLEKVNSGVPTLPLDPVLDVSSKVKVEYLDEDLLGSSSSCVSESVGNGVQEIEVRNDVPTNFNHNNVNHIALEKRRGLLLGRINSNYAGLPVTAKKYSSLEDHRGGPEATKLGDYAQGGGEICLSLKLYSTEVQNSLPLQIDRTKSSTLQPSVKVEPSDGIESFDMQNLGRKIFDDLSFTKLQIDSEVDSLSKLYDEMIDNMTLADRIKLRKSLRFSEQTTSSNSECLEKVVPFSSESSLVVSESAKLRRVRRPQKRKKTATGSVVEALEEDAPELLQFLVKEGILVDDIKLYGEADSVEALDESLDEDDFSELEEVMSKIFSSRNSLLKFPPIRCAKGSKPSYCLDCLFSLVEQARYLRFRKWPVEWGWCRDLRSFIFVFERHKRIVIERPEYGYATYFFELVCSSPIEWQIKRLVTSMRLTGCGRIMLMENKPLLVGEDLTEGEAKVLMDYGWIPNTGLGTMLNYCDRVVHDRKHEKDTSEWKSKIEKLLIDGFNGGSIVSTTIIDPAMKCEEPESPPIKLEPE